MTTPLTLSTLGDAEAVRARLDEIEEQIRDGVPFGGDEPCGEETLLALLALARRGLDAGEVRHALDELHATIDGEDERSLPITGLVLRQARAALDKTAHWRDLPAPPSKRIEEEASQ